MAVTDVGTVHLEHQEHLAMMITRTLVAAFAAATLTAPSALAQPIDPPLHHAVQAHLPGPPTWPEHPQPISLPVVHHDDGTDLATVGLGIAGGVVAVGAIAGIAVRGRRPQRRRAVA